LPVALANTPHDGQPLGLVLLVLLAAAAGMSALFRRLGVEAIPAYLIAGALAGPHALGLVRSEAAAVSISELATVLLLFTIGLHLDLDAIRRGLVHILAVGVISTLLFVLAAWGIIIALGVPRPAALVLAMGASLSSTAVLMRTLMQRREMQAVHGRVTLGVSIAQDIASVVMLALVPVLVQWGSAGVLADDGGINPAYPEWLGVLFGAARAVAGVFLLLALGRVVLPWLLHRVARLGSQELVLVASAAIAMAAAVWTSYIGFSPEMGAFIAGFLLAGTPFRFQLAGQLAPLRDLLLAVFFTAVGLRVMPEALLPNIGPILAGVLVVVVLKALIIGFTAYVGGMAAPGALLTGVYLGNAGEFTLVIIGAGSAVLSGAQLASTIAVVILSLIVTPLIAGPAHALAARLGRVPLSPWVRNTLLREAPARQKVPATPAQEDRAVREKIESLDDATISLATPLRRPAYAIIAGFGPVGRALADRFAVQGVPFCVVELNASTVLRQGALGRRVVYGDITNREVLEEAGIHHADAVILTIPDDEASLRACAAVHEIAPHVFLAVRVKFLSGKFTAMALGANVATVEEVATAHAMEREVLDGLAHWLDDRARTATAAVPRRQP